MKERFKGLSQERLVELATSGSEEAEEFLIREYKSVIRSKARTYFITGAEMEDVIQEGMIGLLKAIKTYSADGAAGFSTYANHCITRQILDAIKAANRKKHGPLNSSVSLSKPAGEDSNQTLEESVPSRSTDNPEAMLITKDFLERVAASIDGELSLLEKKVWSGHMAGRSSTEIARELGKNEKAVYNAMDRTKKKIVAQFYTPTWRKTNR